MNKKNKENLRCKIEEQVAYEEKAFRNVEKVVLADSVSKEDLEVVINQIMPGHYADIIEERSISKVCGYPLCQNKIAKVPKHNVHISLKHKKIYDITERKLFCSNFCFKASKYLESQIPTDPLWLRKDKFTKVEFLEKEEKSSPSNSQSNEERPEIITNDKIIEKEVMPTNVAENYKKHLPKSDFQDVSTRNSSAIEVKVSEVSLTNRIEASIKKPLSLSIVDIKKLCTCLEEWCTEETFKLFDNGGDQFRKPFGSETKLDPQSSGIEAASECKSKSIFMNRFLRENREWKSEVGCSAEKPEQSSSKAFVSPPVDSRSQQTIRRRIVSQKLKNGLSEVFSDLSLSMADFRINLASLVKTLSFTSQNITLKAKEWKLVAAALLTRIASQDVAMNSLLDTRKSQTAELLSSCDVCEEQFDELLSILTRNKNRSDSPISLACNDSEDYDNDSLD